jgi:Ca2+-binding RTX toxin-like protein
LESFTFEQAVNMTTFDFSKYAGGGITGFSSTEVVFTDAAGDTLDLKGTNFSPFPVSGTVTSFTATDVNGHAILTGSNLDIDVGQLYADRNDDAALALDLFGGGVAIIGSAFNDTLVGGAGNDTLTGGLGVNTLDGGGGSNVASYATAGAGVTVALKAGAQKTRGAGTDTLVHIESLTGSNFNDTLTGDAHANKLVGGAGNDTLIGGGGNDTLTGGAGADKLTGGAGNVKFAYTSVSDSTSAAHDLITDFHTGDKIVLSSIDANTALAGRQSFHLGATKGHAGDVVVTYNAAHNETEVKLYVNADATADAVIMLTGDHVLTTADFVGVTAPAAVHSMVQAMAAFAPTTASPLSTPTPRALTHTSMLAAHR